eukprot:TRINITY_DN1364_c0_g1_i10.p1 TRINITY_DN1364_c0_g1~~TRINITY_DN1364_c0_g1_i10.p1  ORF type:complete len:2094 (-),score=587.98 TRINITY_DN1364_c0_g1_i10:49-6330(-)
MTTELNLLESFALSSNDRRQTLEQLLPSADKTYFTILEKLNKDPSINGDILTLLQTLREQEGHSQRYAELENRIRLLEYATSLQDAATTSKFFGWIRQKLALHFDYTVPLVQEASLRESGAPTHPSTLDQAALSFDAFLARFGSLESRAYTNLAISYFLDHFNDPSIKTSDKSLGALLSLVATPDHPKLVQYILQDFREQKGQRPFGVFGIHNQLTLTQLDELKKQMPSLLDSDNFIRAYITVLAPSASVDWIHDAAERKAYHQRLWNFVWVQLPPVRNPMKATLLYHILQSDRQDGVYDEDKFMDYIQFPRQASYMSRDYLTKPSIRENIFSSNSPVGQLSPVPDDTPLVTDYLLHLLKDKNDIAPYQLYLDSTFLKRLFVLSKLSSGKVDPHIFDLLTPAQRQEINDSVLIEFTAQNKEQFNVDDVVEVDLNIKNVKTLLIKVFEINTKIFYREEKRDIPTDINLDGLVPSHQEEHQLNLSASQMTERKFSFPSLKQRGVYVIEIIGNGKSSRAIVKKGYLRMVQRLTVAGHAITVFDEKEQIVKDAAIQLNDHTFQADQQGLIRIPYTSSTNYTQIIVSSGSFAELKDFQHMSESYNFQCGIFVDRESLIRLKRATVIVRPTLTVNGSVATLKMLNQVKLIIKTYDQDHVESIKTVDNFKLKDGEESSYQFTVPDSLRTISIEVTGQIKTMAGEENQSAHRSWEINSIDSTSEIGDIHLIRNEQGYAALFLGKTGDIKAKRVVTCQIRHNLVNQTISQILQTDDNGMIFLGHLENVSEIFIEDRPFDIRNGDYTTHPSVYQAPEGVDILIPFELSGKELWREVNLLEKRDYANYRDLTSTNVTCRDGYLVISKLTPGDYTCHLKKQDKTVDIKVEKGTILDNYVCGPRRILQVTETAPLTVVRVEEKGEQIEIQLGNPTQSTRVHLLCSHFVPKFSVSEYLDCSGVNTTLALGWSKPETQYLNMRVLGDEYVYVLERQYANKSLVGNMLARPSLLLNPWAVAETNTDIEAVAAGTAYSNLAQKRMYAPAAAPCAAMRSGAFGGSEQGRFNLTSNLDFLPESSRVILNLKPDAQGIIVIPRKELGLGNILRVVAVDGQDMSVKTSVLRYQPIKYNDLRLGEKALDPTEHYTEQKQVSVVLPGQLFDLDLSSSKMETYDNISRIYKLLSTLDGGRVSAFSWIQDWESYSENEKLQKYQKFACHELHFFLAKKDPKFFAWAVLPYLVNKMQKTFMDEYLIGSDLSCYFEPSKFQLLNVVEKILLGDRTGLCKNEIAEHVAYSTPVINVERSNHIFNTALNSGSLDEPQEEMLQSMVKRAPSKRMVQKEKSEEPFFSMQDAEEDEEAEGYDMDRARFEESSSRGYMGMQQDFEARSTVNRLEFKKAEKTKEYAESNYYKVSNGVHQQGSLVQPNHFWKDYALYIAHRKSDQDPFISKHFGQATHTLTDTLLALSVMDVPFSEASHEINYGDTSVHIKAKTAMVIFHKGIKQASAEDTQTLQVSQYYFDPHDRYVYEDGEQVEKRISGEFLIDKVYGCQVDLSNMSSKNQRVDVLLQIPAGSLPVSDGFYTKGKFMEISPNSSTAILYHFYFPLPGNFTHFPAHVCDTRTERMIGYESQVFNLKAVKSLTQVEKRSWKYVSEMGTTEEVLQYLKSDAKYDLKDILWRLKDAKFFKSMVDALKAKLDFDSRVWAFSVYHQDSNIFQEYLAMRKSDFRVGPHFPLFFQVEPVELGYEHLEYMPLINARVFMLGKRKRVILNDRFKTQYEAFLKNVCYKDKMSVDDILAATYYLFLQDRQDEAIAMFRRIDASAGQGISRVEAFRKSVNNARLVLQYAYACVYVDFYLENLGSAGEVVSAYKDYPVMRWRNLFREADAQLTEIFGKSREGAVDLESRDEQQALFAVSEPTFDFQVENNGLAIEYANLKCVEVSYFKMDLELMFSSNPFVSQGNKQFSYIKPNRQDVIQLEKTSGKHFVELPKEFANSNIIINVSAGGSTKSHPHYSNTMSVQVMSKSGQVKVSVKDSQQSLPRVYVKVYAKFKDGGEAFYKDGFTDLRGRFDYASLSTDEIDRVAKFAILIQSQEHGAVVKEAPPPTL